MQLSHFAYKFLRQGCALNNVLLTVNTIQIYRYKASSGSWVIMAQDSEGMLSPQEGWLMQMHNTQFRGGRWPKTGKENFYV